MLVSIHHLKAASFVNGYSRILDGRLEVDLGEFADAFALEETKEVFIFPAKKIHKTKVVFRIAGI